jgi:hypothetical protein
MNFDFLERLLVRRKFVDLKSQLATLLKERSKLLPKDVERLVALELRLVIATDGVAKGVALLGSMFAQDRVPFELLMLW